MNPKLSQLVELKKLPVQLRGTSTVAQLIDATERVLLTNGLAAITTTKIAKQAGLAVGSLYQYFPNKRVLLALVLERYVREVASAVIDACEHTNHNTVEAVISAVVAAYTRVHLKNVKRAVALVSLIHVPELAAITEQAYSRSQNAISAALVRIEGTVNQTTYTGQFVWCSMTSVMDHVLLNGAPRKMVKALRSQLPLLCISYAVASATVQQSVELTEPARPNDSAKYASLPQI
jgi:AcrR family transcriptional regulator